MEDLFARLRAWLSDSSTALEALSPPAEEEEQREEQLRKATVSLLASLVYQLSFILVVFFIEDSSLLCV